MAPKHRPGILDGDTDKPAAAALVLQREQERKEQAKARARKQYGQRQRKQLAAVEQMGKSIEVIKGLLVGIAVVVTLGVAFLSWSLSETREDIAEIRTNFTDVVADVAEIERQVDQVKSSLPRPIESLGRKLGEQLDSKLPSLSKGKPEGSEN